MVKHYWLLCILLVSCKAQFADLSIERKDYAELPFKTNGYYYNFYSNSSGKEFVTAYFYYKSGVQLHWGSPPLMSFTELENQFVDSGAISRIGVPRNRWRVFEINGDTIVLETWTETLAMKVGTFKSYRKIINDTTLYSIGLDKYYHFREFSPKPDSTYSPIK